MLDKRPILLIIAAMFFFGCKHEPHERELERLVQLLSSTSDHELCIATEKPISAVQAEIQDILATTGYDCCKLNLKLNDQVEDSVLILTKKKILEVQTLYFDFAKRQRQLKTWNYPNAADKRVRLDDNIYLQTTGFD